MMGQYESGAVRLLEIFVVMAACMFLYATSKAPYEGTDVFSNQYEFPQLEYGYDDLEPYIDGATLQVHHKGHHMGYTNKINIKLELWRTETSDELASKSIIEIIANINKVPKKYRKAIQDFGGGFLNHALYFAVMSKNSENKIRLPEGVLQQEIEKAFGSFDKFKDEFTRKALGLFGSGYTWLNQRPTTGGGLNLVITTTVNQDSPLVEGFQPILTLDVWEHAYYLKHQLRRPVHVQEWWFTVDWNQVTKLSNWWQQIENHDEL